MAWVWVGQLIHARSPSDFGKRAERNRGRKVAAIKNTRRDLGLGIAIVAHERGIPSKRDSSYRADYVPALCTHRPSLLPIGSFSEASGLAGQGRSNPPGHGGEVCRTQISRGSKSRNKVSVGEPAEGSLPRVVGFACYLLPMSFKYLTFPRRVRPPIGQFKPFAVAISV